jgi:hypothetical protein
VSVCIYKISIEVFIPVDGRMRRNQSRERVNEWIEIAEVSQREQKFLAMTSLTVEAFAQLVPALEEAFQERMKEWCWDSKPRTGRGYTSYANCLLPSPEDRLLFILVYLKTHVLQIVQGELFGMPQNKANQSKCPPRNPRVAS